MPVSFLMDRAIWVCYLATTEKIYIPNVGFNCYKRNYLRWVRYPLFCFLFFCNSLLGSTKFFHVFISSQQLYDWKIRLELWHRSHTYHKNYMRDKNAYCRISPNMCEISNKQYPLNALHHHCVKGVRIFSHSDWIRSRITPNMNTLYTVHLTVRSNKCRDPQWGGY